MLTLSHSSHTDPVEKKSQRTVITDFLTNDETRSKILIYFIIIKNNKRKQKKQLEKFSLSWRFTMAKVIATTSSLPPINHVV